MGDNSIALNLVSRAVGENLPILQSCYHFTKCIPFNLQRHRLPASTRTSNAIKG